MTRYAAFLRGVNLGKRTVKSADLKAAMEKEGFGAVKTLINSGNVLFDAAAGEITLTPHIENGLRTAFGFEIGVVLRTLDVLRAMVAANPFGRGEGDDAKLYVMLFARKLPDGFSVVGVEGDYDIVKITEREVFAIGYKKPDGTYSGSGGLTTIEKHFPKGSLVTSRNWNTILKASA